MSYAVTIKATLEISQTFVAFLEYMNFTKRELLVHAFYRVAASISQRIPVILVRKKSCSGASLLLLLLPSIHEKTIYGVNVMGAIRKLFSYWFSLKWEENGAAFFFGGNFALFSCGNSTAQTTKNGLVKLRFCEKVTTNL